MKIKVRLESVVSESFRAVRAANSVDLDSKKKATHELEIDVELGEYSVGLIVGASGSGKTTLAQELFGRDCFKTHLDLSKAVIDQLPADLSYDDSAAILQGVGLTSIPCWIKPAGVLSNGQKARAEAALAMMSDQNVLIDEWTSVVDRTVAKVMSHCVQKFARRKKKQVTLVSCHYDVIEWLDPDWVIDCNTQTFSDRRLLRPEDRRRREQLEFTVREISSASWKYFSKYHYLSEKLPGGRNYYFGLFSGIDQIGFVCFSNYVAIRKGSVPMFHFNRAVIHPDYAGFGLGLRLVNAGAKYLKSRYGYDVRGAFSSEAMFRATMSDKTNWKCLGVERRVGQYKNVGNGVSMRSKGFRENVKLYSFQYVGE